MRFLRWVSNKKILNLIIRWSHPRAQCCFWLTGGPRAHCRPLLPPLALSSPSLPRAFPRFLHRRRLARMASRPYRVSARCARCRGSVHSPHRPACCRHCSRIRLRTPAIRRRAALVDFAHRTPSSSYKTAEVSPSSSSHLASLFLLLLPPFPVYKSSGGALMAEAMPDWFAILVCGGLEKLLGLSVLLCAMILDDRRDAAAQVLALRGGDDHEE